MSRDTGLNMGTLSWPVYC